MTGSGTRHLGLTITAAIAVIFGALTIISGGRALFGSVEAQTAVGDAVPFVLIFNFAAGFAYVIAGFAMLFQYRWALWLSAFILAATLLVLLGFGLHVFRGGAYEMRTVGAMFLRTALWAIAVTVIAWSERRLKAVTNQA